MPKKNFKFKSVFLENYFFYLVHSTFRCPNCVFVGRLILFLLGTDVLVMKGSATLETFHKFVSNFNMICSCVAATLNRIRCITFLEKGTTGGGGGGGTTRPLPRDGGTEELRGDPTVGPHPKVWTIDRE